ncbi:MAG: hypothetical protein WDZ94_01430 [Patescibacteria group bacterium]
MDPTTAQPNYTDPSDSQSGVTAEDTGYVEAYQPPPAFGENGENDGNVGVGTSHQDATTTPVSTPPSPQTPQTPPPTPTQPLSSMSPDPAAATTPSSATSATASTTAATEPSITRGQAEQNGRAAESNSEAIEDQNIFFLLGVTDGEEAQREAFLDELQQVIWEDFLEHDAQLLLTTDEQKELQQMLENRESKDLEKQENIIVFLEKLIPDLEEIMLEKALELKSDMVRERAQGLRQFYADSSEKLSRIDQAEKLMDESKWYSAAHLLNSLNFS